MAIIAKWLTSTSIVPATKATVSVLDCGGVYNESIYNRRLVV